MTNVLGSRYVAFIKESTYGTAVAASSSYKIGEVDDESFTQQFDVLNRASMSHYGATAATEGLFSSSGDINAPVILDDFTLICFFEAFGVDTFDASSKQHLLSETTDEDNLNSYTIRVGRENKEHVFTGMVLDSISLSANINEYAMFNASFVGCGESATASLQTPGSSFPDFEGSEALHFSRAFVRFGNAATDTQFSKAITSFEVTINLGRDVENARSLGDTTYVRKPNPTLREISGSIEFNRALYASSQADDPGGTASGSPTYDELRAGLDRNGDSAGQAALSILLEESGGSNFFRMDLFNVHFEAPEASVSGRDSQTMSVSFVGLFDLGDSNAMARCLFQKDGLNGNALYT